MGKMESFNLLLQPYCEFCPDFSADVEQTDVTVLMDTTPKVVTAIRCHHRGKCARVTARVREMAEYEGAEDI